MRRSVLALASAVMMLLSAVLVPGAAAQTTGADYDLAGGIGHFYTQTNGGAGAQYGYRITNNGGIGFWSAFQRLGGVPALGYPVSRRFSLGGFTVQAMQKVIMQWRPDVSPPQVYFVNVFDELHNMGLDAALQSQYQIPAQLDPSFDAGKTASQAQSARLALLNADAAIAGRYNASPSPLLYNGLPTSQVTDEGPFVTLRAQRVAIQHWKVADPAAGIKAGDVTVVNGGDIAKKLGLVPSAAAYTETADGALNAPVPTATPLPAATAAPQPTATPAPSYAFLSKDVTTPPVDCGGGNRVPCVSEAPNGGTQFIQGHVMDKNGNGIGGIIVRATAYGNNYDGTSEPDGTFSIIISTSCPIENRVYQVYVIDGQGNQSSDVRTVNYSNCNTAGEFHFDFVRQS